MRISERTFLLNLPIYLSLKIKVGAQLFDVTTIWVQVEACTLSYLLTILGKLLDKLDAGFAIYTSNWYTVFHKVSCFTQCIINANWPLCNIKTP